MPVPTPDQLHLSLSDVARGYDAELTGPVRPDPMLGQHLAVQARRIRNRVDAGDERLTAFEPFTDASGYVWIPEPAVAYLADEGNRLWSFERWFTGFAAAVRATAPPAAEDLSDAAATGVQVDEMAAAGFQPTHIDGKGLLLKRK